MSNNQSQLGDYHPDASAPLDWIEWQPSEYRNELGFYGIDANLFGERPLDHLDYIGADSVYRLQYTKQYYYPRRDDGGNTAYAPMQFRVTVYTVGQPHTALDDYLRDVANPRLRGLCDTDGGGQTFYGSPPYIEGFFHQAGEWAGAVDAIDREMKEVALDEPDYLGLPTFSVEIYTEDGVRKSALRGKCTGFLDPFTPAVETESRERGERPPQHEVWHLTWNGRRDSYDVHPAPKTSARRRAQRGEMQGKSVYVNDQYIGDLDGEGRAWLKKKYGTRNEQWGNRWSREKLVAETPATYSAIRRGGNLYKGKETNAGIYLYTAKAKPTGFDPVDPDAVSEDAWGVEHDTITRYILDLNEQAPTHFYVDEDRSLMARAGALGAYAPPAERHLTETEERYWFEEGGSR